MTLPDEILFYIKKYSQPGIKIFTKKITYEDIEQYSEDSINNYSIYPNIYDTLKMSPCSGDILIGLYVSNYDYNEDSILLLRDNIFIKYE